jgi:P27 family predicted phage terminase small subunit
MAGRKPKLTGDRAREGAAGILAEGLSLAQAQGVRAPTILDRHGKSEWNRIVAGLAPRRNLSVMDLGALEMCCHAYQRWRNAAELMKKDGPEGPYQTTPQGFRTMSAEAVELAQAFKQYRALASDFGVTPVARIKTNGTAQGELDFGDAARPHADHDPTDPLSLH